MPTVLPTPYGYYMSTGEPNIYNYRNRRGRGYYGPWEEFGGDIIHPRERSRGPRWPPIWDDDYDEPEEYGPPYDRADRSGIGCAIFEGPNYFDFDMRGPGYPHRRRRRGEDYPPYYDGWPRGETHYYAGGRGSRRRRSGDAEVNMGSDSGFGSGGWRWDGGRRGNNRIEGRDYRMRMLGGNMDGGRNFFMPTGGNRQQNANPFSYQW